MTKTKVILLTLVAAAGGFVAGYSTPQKMIQITLDEYQGYVCGYVDGQISILRVLPPDQSLPKVVVDHAKCDHAAGRQS